MVVDDDVFSPDVHRVSLQDIPIASPMEGAKYVLSSLVKKGQFHGGFAGLTEG